MLGLPPGSAANRLRKILMFDMACKLGLLTCFRCGNQIETPAEFSIDHKIAWERADNPHNAFFDLGNIAFSHPVCNARAAHRPKKYNTSEEARAAKKAWRQRPENAAKLNKSRRILRRKQKAARG
jgi:hypothetical protein